MMSREYGIFWEFGVGEENDVFMEFLYFKIMNLKYIFIKVGKFYCYRVVYYSLLVLDDRLIFFR